MSELAQEIRTALRAAADPERAHGMAAYLKVTENQTLPPLGIRRPEVRSIARGAARGLEPGDILSAVDELWDHADHREERYAAQDLLGMRWARARLDLLPRHEHQITTGAWWDHVDESIHRIADLTAAHPQEMAPVLRAWCSSSDRWLRRAAILGALGDRRETDLALLEEVLEPNLGDPEFFVRKAIGWALREVAKSNPTWVHGYLATHEMSPLSRREAAKHLP